MENMPGELPNRYLITGVSGFVAGFFLELIAATEPDAEVMGIARRTPAQPLPGSSELSLRLGVLDLCDQPQILEALANFRPNRILHLASQSSVGESWVRPVESFLNNTNIFLNLVDSVRQLGLACRILSVGSSEEYGAVTLDDIPLNEQRRVVPLSPYGVARVSQEMLSRVFVDGYGLDIVMTRSFNHIGPRQRDQFVIPSFARQLVRISQGFQEPVLETGDLGIVRDFVDVRDVAKAYLGLFDGGVSGEVYNVCSGSGLSLGEVLGRMARLVDVEVRTVTVPSLVRPRDNPVIVGDSRKIRETINWSPGISLDSSLSDILGYWKSR